MSLIEKARAWIAIDPDPDTRRELETLIAEGNREALEERFSQNLHFGTAGLRGLLGAGPARMNRVTVSRATAGLCAWLARTVPEARDRGVCVARDARPKSDAFERDVVEVATAAGFRVLMFEGMMPTPVLAFSVLRTGSAGGVMITASHNPPGYNGYKVFWENGAQIIGPNDEGIAREIEIAASAPLPRLNQRDATRAGLVREVDALREAYVEAIAHDVPVEPPRESVRIAYTALHGVAEHTFRQVLARAGFHDVHSVPEQAIPDGRFPTVEFPNPEEPGAMDRVLALGRDVDADLVVANDPDGDRVAVAARDPDGFETLSGNDLGIVLADDLLAHSDPRARRVVLSTVVSSPMLGPVAQSHGARWEQTATGHKWIQNRAIELESQGYTYIFGYEEALGYAVSPLVRDKDGISAALRIADLASRLKAKGQTLLDARDTLFRKHGFCADRQVSVRYEGAHALSRMKQAIDRIRSAPPRSLGDVRVVRTSEPDPGVLVFELEGGHRAMLRSSGTEPKLKHYFYAVSRVTPSVKLEDARTRAHAVLDDIADGLTRLTRRDG